MNLSVLFLILTTEMVFVSLAKIFIHWILLYISASDSLYKKLSEVFEKLKTFHIFMLFQT